MKPSRPLVALSSALSGLLRAAPVLAPVLALTLLPAASHAAGFRAGVAQVDISPTEFPVIVNAMFTERTGTRVVDPLFVRALVLEEGTTRIGIALVDTCMMPRDLLDDAKARVARSTGIPADRLLIAATHTHSAPSAMGCLGSRVDPRYAARLPGSIAQALETAARSLEPALAGSTAFDATGYTHNRRWIRRSDRVNEDPFGERTVRAHMHPGHVSPDVVGPSGPVDPSFTLLSLVRPDGSPLAVFGNFSMHYYESDLMSSDYFGRWCRQMEGALAREHGRIPGRRAAAPAPQDAGTNARPVLALLSQGTSGDLMWMDYSRPREVVGYDAYARALSDKALAAWRGIEHRADVPLGMRETRLPLAYRVADASRLEKSRAIAHRIGDRLPQTLPEIYALEQLELARRGRTELVLQALRVGDMGITALPNEVFALTGLKLKGQSPWPRTMNVELANGAEGYIPPPEQHPLGGYTTWAARTAGLETNAEPRIVDAVLGLMEDLAGRRRRTMTDPESAWSKALRKTRPEAYWRLDEPSTGPLRNQVATSVSTARLEGLHALYLDGIDIPEASGQPTSRRPNHAIHLVDGSLRIHTPPRSSGTLSLWLWNGFPADAAGTTGEILAGGRTGAEWRLQLAGTNGPAGCLQFVDATARQHGTTRLGIRRWHHLALVQDRGHVTVFLDGARELEFPLPAADFTGAWQVGGGGTAAPWQGKVDEVAYHPRPLAVAEIQRLASHPQP